ADTNCIEWLEPAANCFSIEEDDTTKTKNTDAYNACYVKVILREIMIGDDLTRDQQREIMDFMTEFADYFILSMNEV
ncbi:uncharacterized protein BT62DRAFT_834150, partial [Guyanagaster necrorhizus]